MQIGLRLVSSVAGLIRVPAPTASGRLFRLPSQCYCQHGRQFQFNQQKVWAYAAACTTGYVQAARLPAV